MFVLTFTGILAPFVWQSSHDARSISVKLLASTTLQPGAQAGIKDLQVTLNGRRIDDPYLSLFEVVNDGSKSILPGEFETPIELVPLGDAVVVTAQITTTFPKGITAKVSTEDKRVMIAPYLSNSEDSVFVTVITSGGQPTFGAQARIAGVKQISYIDSSVPQSSEMKLVIKVAGAFYLAVMYFLFAMAAGRNIILSRPLAYSTGFAFTIGCGLTFASVGNEIEKLFPFPFGYALALAGMMLIACLVAIPILHRISRS
ncbi:hypothetical protein ACKUG4_04415 [Pseudomonas glycinae]|uniref:hypothetical protein n=1 Tax=Candidatus Pseudomonas auctus TaxID=3461260 RepID=UPI003B8FA691